MSGRDGPALVPHRLPSALTSWAKGTAAVHPFLHFLLTSDREQLSLLLTVLPEPITFGQAHRNGLSIFALNRALLCLIDSLDIGDAVCSDCGLSTLLVNEPHLSGVKRRCGVD